MIVRALFGARVLALLLVCNDVHAQGPVFRVDSTNSFVQFSAVHMGFLEVEGTIGGIQGEITPSGSSYAGWITIPVDSIRTGNRLRDRSLRSSSFLASEEYPVVGVTLDGGRILLSLRGVERPVEPELEVNWNEDALSVHAVYVLKRSEFDLTFSTMDDLIGDHVQVDVHVQAVAVNR